jgi:hypothetical protein
MAKRSGDARSDRALDSSGMRQHIDRDGLKISERPGRRKRVWIGGLLASLALALALAVAVAWIGRGDPAPLARASLAESAPEPAPIAVEAPRAVPVRRPEAAPDEAPPLEPPSDDVVIDVEVEDATAPDFTLPVPGAEPTGIALFPKPGTDPPRIGIIVPDDFEMPPGFIRHYQATDDGQELAPILLFHPDFDFVDANGDPIELPESRVVPPELAPTGLEIELLELPEPLPDDAP